jgi:uncharacterized repeat protein (TIGR01451 family)
MLHQLFSRFKRSTKRSTRTAKKRALRMESMEKRELMASDLGVIAGTTFVDQGNDGFDVSDPPVLVDANGDLVAPGTAGATGVQIQLFEDTNNDMIFDANDQLVGTLVSGLDGSYRFDRLSPGDYFVQQATVPQLQTPTETLVSVVNDSGVRTELIDDYTDGTQNVTATAGNTVDDSATGLANVVGGGRDVQSSNSAATGQVTLFVDSAAGSVSIGSLGDGVGTALIQYDGADNSIALDADGLGGVSLGGGAATEALDPDAGLIVRTRAETAGDTLVITVRDMNGGSSTANIPVPQDAANFIETFVRFSTFSNGADFNNVGSIEASLGLSANNDVFVNIVEAITPEIVTTNLANIQTLSLGGEVFIDNAPGFQNDGMRQGSESGQTAVTVDLYLLAGANDVVDPANDTPIASTTTGPNGAYTFGNLVPGNYATVIPASNFANGATLFGFANSTGNDPAPDPDDNTDGDDSGSVTAGGDVISGTITLESNLEPTDDDDTDPNTNTTLDFGFFPQIDLRITKTLNEAASDSFAGGTAVFDIVVENLGPLDATNVEVVDAFPAGLTFTGISNTSGTFTQSTTGNTTTIDLGTVVVGVAETFTLTTTIGANQTADLTNTATVATEDQVETDATNNSDDALLDIITTDLRISKTDVTDPVNAGEQITYQITVVNDGPDDATGVVVRDMLPAGVTFVSGDVGGAANLVTVDGATGDILGTIGTLANGATAVVTVVVDVATDATSPLNNTASVSADPNTDPDLTNNTTDEDTTILRQVDVAITKNVQGTPIAGADLTYELIVTNNGPGEARGVSVIDTLDANLTFVNGSLNAGTTGITVSQTGQQLTFDVGTLDAQETRTFTFDVTLSSSATGTIPNVATVSTTDTDTDNTNNSDNEDVTVGRSIDLILEKTVDLVTAVPGQDQLVYTFTVSHDTDSVSDAVDVVVTDVLPANAIGAVISAATADSQNFDSATNTATVNFDALPIGETRTFTITVDIPEAATGTIVNPASVTSTGDELDTTNNDDTATTTLTPVFDVVVNKTVDNAAPIIGGTVTYTVGLTNEGPSTATGVVLSDVVPTGLTFVSGTLEGNAGVLTGNTVSFPGITLDNNESVNATLTFTVDATASGTITNTASVPDLSAAGEDDVTNNSDDADIVVTPQTDVTIEKTVSATTAQAGQTLTYTINVTNNGPSPASAVTVTDTLPAGVTFVSGTGPNGALTATGQVVTVNGGDLADQGSFSFTVQATVNAGAIGIQTNTATVSTTTQETNAGNNSATAATTIDPVTGSLAGTVYVDANNNGVQDAGEAGIEGVILTLTGTDSIGNNVDLTATTNAAGDYLFAQLAAGTYSLTQTQPAGFRDGQEDAGIGATANVGDDVFTNLVLDPAATATEFDFGELDAPLSKRRFLASSRSVTETT